MTTANPARQQATERAPWNKGHLIGPKPPLKLPEVWGIRIRLQLEHDPRQLALFNLAIDSKLRGCDLVSLQVRDVIHGSQAVKRAVVIQKKTDRPVQFELTPQTRQAAEKWVSKAHLQPGDCLFPSRMHDSPHISTRAVRETRKVLGGRARVRPCRVRHPFPTPNEGDSGLPTHAESARRAASPWAHEAGEHCPAPWDRG